MTNLQHTPGPWTSVHTTPSGFPLRIETAENLPTHIAEMVTVNDNLYGDARLIVEAPTMLDILLRVKDAIEALDGTSMENEKLVDDYRALLNRIFYGT